MKKQAIILEGGANRGVFTAGVLDYLMEQNCYIPNVIGVSAGCCNAVDYVSRQPGRTKECVIRAENDGKLLNLKNVVKTHSLMDLDLLFEKDPFTNHKFDFETYFSSKMKCEIVITNCLTGKAEYLQERKDKQRLMQMCRASCSMPLVTPMVYLDGVPYLDGGIADSVPVIHSLKTGNDKNVIILTRQKGYRKSISKRSITMIRTALRKYPNLARALCTRAHEYNKVMTYIEKWEEEGKVFVIRPEMKPVSRIESDPKLLTEFYDHGYEQMKKNYDDMRRFLCF